MNWNARKFWQQNHTYNGPRSRRFQTQVTWIHYKRTQFVFQLQRYNILKLKFADLPAHDRQTVICVTNNLHGLDWDEGDIPYCDLKTLCICLSFSFRFARKNLFAKGI